LLTVGAGGTVLVVRHVADSHFEHLAQICIRLVDPGL
jgi:hypothetical protein